MEYSSYNDYLADIRRRSVLPQGFHASTTVLAFSPRERDAVEPMEMNLSLILLDEPSSAFAGTFTSNAFPGAPVVHSREVLAGPRVRGIVANNKIANVCAPEGLESARRVLARVADSAGGEAEEYFVASTGIIGWQLPTNEMISSVEALVGGLQDDTILNAAMGIMTTDSYPKVRTAEVGDGRIVGIAKGAGMIEPNMATMLCFLLTDCRIDKPAAQEALSECVDRTFNRITVDGDQSTSDMVLLLSSNQVAGVEAGEFEAGLSAVCGDLAADIVRNGEGVGHVMRVRVHGGATESAAAGAARAIANSPLVKTAVFGNDPNVGRLINALGDYAGVAGDPFDPERVTVSLGGIDVFSRGVFDLDSSKERRLSDYLLECGFPTSGKRFPLHERFVEIAVDLGLGNGSCEVLGGDLSYDYIKENADYRT